MAYYHYWNHSNSFSQNEYISEDYCTSSNNNNYGIQYQEEPEIEYGSDEDQLLHAESHMLDEYVRMPNHNLETEYGSLEDQLLYTEAYVLVETSQGSSEVKCPNLQGQRTRLRLSKVGN